MSTKSPSKLQKLPSVFNEVFRPWNEWFDREDFNGRTLSIPAVNIKETKNEFVLSLAVPGMKKEDFHINVEGNMLTISCEKEEETEEKHEKYNRKEFNYSSFSRSFTLPEEVKQEKIDARYTDGVLNLVLPKKEEAKKNKVTKAITVK